MMQNRFLKHPKTSIFFLGAGIILVLALGFEKYLAWTKPVDKDQQGIKRHILLKEMPPFFRRRALPTDDYLLNYSDSLIRKEFKVDLDKDGFIYPSHIHDNPDISIFFLGGSTTACNYVEEQNRFPYLVGRLLENGQRKVNSYNSGVDGNNTLHSLDILLNKIIPMKPDIVAMMENVNDLSILLYEGDYWNNNPYESPLVNEEEKTPFSKIKNGVRGIFGGVKDLLFPNLYSKIEPFLFKEKEIDKFAGIRGKKITINKEYLLKKFKTNLQTFINICRANDIVPILMTQASRFKEKPDEVVAASTWRLDHDFGIKYPQFKEMFDAFNETIRTIGAENNVLVIDLARKVPQEKEYMYDYDHYNDNGSRFVAKIIANELLRHEDILRSARN